MRFQSITRTLGTLALVGGLGLLPACDSDPSGQGSDDNAVLVGSVASSSAQMQAAGLSGAQQGSQNASFVAAGTLRADGTLNVLAEAQVEADGSFRIEGLPAGRSGLVVRAESDSGEEVGRVIVHQETVADAETGVAPIDASSTLHARVTGAIHGANPDPVASAEIALRMRVSAQAAAGWSSSDISAYASGVTTAEAAEAAVLAEWNAGIDAGTRDEILLNAIVSLEQSLHAGADLSTVHRAYQETVIDALVSAGVDARAMAAAQASAVGTADLAWSTSGNGAIHLGALRNAARLNLFARSRLAADTEGNPVGLGSAAVQVLAELESGIEGASTTSELRQSAAQLRAELQGSVSAAVLGTLSGLPIELITSIESELHATLATAELWTALEAASSAEARAAATATWAADVEAAVQSWVETLPDETAAEIDVAAATRLFMAIGAGPVYVS